MRDLRSDPLLLALVLQAGIIPVALLLALLAGVAPWRDFHLTGGALLIAIAGTLPFILALDFFARLRPSWFRELDDLIRPTLEALFRGRGQLAVVVVSLLAGLGEELLFRGVLQAWLAGFTNPWFAIVLAGVVFGLLHYLSRAYFIYATILGVYLGAIYHYTDNLLIVVLIHALYDWIAINRVLGGSIRAGR